MHEHLIFYDGSCGFCDHAVQFLLKHDKQQHFVFAPLQGITAKSLLKEFLPLDEDSLVLIENYQSPDRHYYILGKGAFRALWLVGGVWSIPGAINFLPSSLYDWGYRLIAANRHRWFTDRCILPDANQNERFLE